MSSVEVSFCLLLRFTLQENIPQLVVNTKSLQDTHTLPKPFMYWKYIFGVKIGRWLAPRVKPLTAIHPPFSITVNACQVLTEMIALRPSLLHKSWLFYLFHQQRFWQPSVVSSRSTFTTFQILTIRANNDPWDVKDFSLWLFGILPIYTVKYFLLDLPRNFY